MHEVAPPPTEHRGRSGGRVWISPVAELTNTLFLYMFFCLSPVFSLNMSPDGPVTDVCSAAVSFDLFPPPAPPAWDQTN